MYRTMLYIGAFVFSFAPLITGGPLGVDPGVPDTVRVDSIVAYTYGSGAVPIYFFSDESLAGIEVTLSYDSPDVTVDSFSFVGGRAEYVSLKGLSATDSTITIYCFPFEGDALIASGSGLFGKIYFSYQSTISPQVVTIDTVTIMLSDREYASTFSDTIANAFQPQYKKGYLDIQQSTSCCIVNRGNVNNDPNDAVNVTDITYLVNYLFRGGPAPVCLAEANVNGDPGELVNVVDLTYLVNYLFRSGSPPPSCF
jgi:hypothetical protein